MESGARGCEIIVSGKLRGQRAKAMKFMDGLLIHSGDPTNHFLAKAIKHVELRQGVLGIKIKIMLNYDPSGKNQRTLRFFLIRKNKFVSRVRSVF
jgi:small subunit ribosomal protein S3e